MMDERTPRDPSTGTAKPDVPADVVADEGMENQGVADGSRIADIFVAAFQVTIRADHFELMAPLESVGDGPVSLTIHGPMDSPAGHMLHGVKRLPLKDLANPRVALVVRPSLERLVRAAREMQRWRGGAGDKARFEHERELDAALESFADIEEGS